MAIFQRFAWLRAPGLKMKRQSQNFHPPWGIGILSFYFSQFFIIKIYIKKKKCRERNHSLSSCSYFQMENSWKFKRKHKIEGILCPFPVTLKAGTQTKRVDEGRFILGATSKTLTCPLHPSQVPLYNRHKALDAECPYVGDNSPFTEEEQEKPK